MALEAICD